MNFQDFWSKFSLIFGQLCDKKTCGFVMMGIGKNFVWAGGGMGRGLWQTTPSAGFNISHDADCRSNYLLNIPCPFLDIFCFKQSGHCN